MAQKNSSKKNTISLKVCEAYTRDVGRAVARIDYKTMNALNVSTGDVIEINGKTKTVAKALPLYPADEGKGIIRIDGLGRTNSGIAIGDKLSIKKIKALAAQKVIIKSLEAIPPIDTRYLADALESVPLTENDKVMVPYFGGRLTFQIEKILPLGNAVVVTQKTIFEIIENNNQQPKTKNFFKALTEMYDEEFSSFQKCRNDKKLFNILVGKFLIKTEGVIDHFTASKFIECLMEASEQ